MPHLSIIFDLDGTLLDTLDGLAETTNGMLARLGYPQHPPEAFRHYVGDGLHMLIKRSLPTGADEQAIDRGCALFMKMYAANWKTSCRPYDDIPELLATLRDRGIPLAVLSNKPHAFTQVFIEEFFPAKTFTRVYGQRDGFAKKPDPCVALEIAAELGTSPSRTLFVGDTPVDMQTGRNAAMLTAGVSWGFRSVRELTAEHPHIIVNYPLELVEYAASLT